MVPSLNGIPEVTVLHINGNSSTSAGLSYLSPNSLRKMYNNYGHFLPHTWRSRPKLLSLDATLIQQLTQIDMANK